MNTILFKINSIQSLKNMTLFNSVTANVVQQITLKSFVYLLFDKFCQVSFGFL